MVRRLGYEGERGAGVHDGAADAGGVVEGPHGGVDAERFAVDGDTEDADVVEGR